MTRPPSGLPGHTPGYRLHGTLIPMAAIASLAPRPMTLSAAAALYTYVGPPPHRAPPGAVECSLSVGTAVIRPGEGGLLFG